METTIWVPGNWTDRNEIVTRVAQTAEYLFIGLLMKDLVTNDFFKADIFTPDWTDKEAFAYFNAARPDPISAKDLGLTCTTPIFSLTCETGSIESLEKLAKAAAFLLKLGGIGIKVINGGSFLTREEWDAHPIPNLHDIFEAFVLVYWNKQGVFSSGMHNFGLRDVFVPLENDKDSNYLVRSFAWYVLNEKPIIKCGETFSLGPEEPYFKVLETSDNFFPVDDPYHNPYGLWKLCPITEDVN